MELTRLRARIYRYNAMMRLTIKKQENGDTLIEVLLVTAILSVIVVTATALMNRAYAGTQVALEQTVVRQSMEGQVEMLTFTRDQVAAGTATTGLTSVWSSILADVGTAVSPYGRCLGSEPLVGDPFALHMNGNTTLTFNDTPGGASGIARSGSGVWVEGLRPAGADYIDFYVYSCWQGPVVGPNMTLGTTVRLNVP